MTAVGALFAACAPAAPIVVEVEKPVVVREEVIKEVPVEKIVEVERIVEVTAVPEEKEPIRVYGFYMTDITEAWDQAIHRPLLVAAEAGRIICEWTAALGSEAAMERELRLVAETWNPDLMIGDAFGSREAVKRVAADYPNLLFAFGSDQGPVQPNLFTFDNENQGGSKAGGWSGGKLTQSNVIGMVLGVDCAEVNRLGWAFIKEAQRVNPEVTILASYIKSWHDLPAAEEYAWAMIEQGADFLYCEREGCEQAAKKAPHKVWVIGQMTDMYDKAPENTIFSIVWDMESTVDYLIGLVEAGSETWHGKASYLGTMSRMEAGGTHLSPVHDNIQAQLPEGFVGELEEQVQKIMGGETPLIIEDSIPARIEPSGE